MSKFKKKIEAHKHYWLADNHQHHKGDEVIFKLSFPRVFIRYKLNQAYFASFDDFFGNIAEVQWIDGEIPDKKNTGTNIHRSMEFSVHRGANYGR